MVPCITNSKKKRKMMTSTKEKIEDQLELIQYMNNAKILKHLNNDHHEETGNQIVTKEKYEMDLSSED